jgi:hypothetical protein
VERLLYPGHSVVDLSSLLQANETCKCNGWKNPKPPTAPRMDLQQPAANLSELCRSCEHPLGKAGSALGAGVEGGLPVLFGQSDLSATKSLRKTRGAS